MIRTLNVVDNLAYKKHTWQTNTRYQYTSSKAVDGKLTLRMEQGNQCAVTGGNVSEAAWTVDLGKVYAFHSIFIYFTHEESDAGKKTIFK